MLALVVVAGTLVSTHPRVVFFGQTFVQRDAIRFRLAVRGYLSETLSAGRLPQWFDGLGFGTPFAGNPVYSVVTPLSWPLAISSSVLAIDLWELLCVLIAGLGTAALARRLGADAWGGALAGAALSACGYVSTTVVSGMAPNLAWTPWVAWATVGAVAVQPERWGVVRRTAPLAVLGSLQVMAGEPASALVAALLVVVLVLALAPRRLAALASLAVPGAFVVGLSSVAWLPARATLARSARAAGLGAADGQWSLDARRLLELVWAVPFGSEQGGGWYAGVALANRPGDPCWSFSLFLGFPVLLLALVGATKTRGAWALLLGSLLFVALAMGSGTPLYRLLSGLAPMGRLVRFPEKFVLGALVLWCALAGVGWRRVACDGIAAGWSKVALVVGLALGLGAGVLRLRAPAAIADLASRGRAWGLVLDWHSGVMTAVAGGMLATAGSLVFAGALGARRRGLRGWHPAAALGVLAPLAVANWLATPVAPRAEVESRPAVLRALPAPAPGAPRPRIFRVPPPRMAPGYPDGVAYGRDLWQSLDFDVAARLGYSALPGFDPGASAGYQLFWDGVARRSSLDALARLLGVSYLMAQDVERMHYVPRATIARAIDGWSLLETGGTRPRAFVAPRWFAVDDLDQAITSLAMPGRAADLGRIALVRPPPGLPQGVGELSPCAVASEVPERVVVDCDSPAGGHAVLLDEMAPGWRATVDGVEASIVSADGLFRAVRLHSGRHRVVFSYRTPGLAAGALLSLLSAVFLLAASLRSRTAVFSGSSGRGATMRGARRSPSQD